MRRSPIAPISARRRAGLAQQGVNFPTSTFVLRGPKLAVPRQPKRPRDTGPDRATAELVAERDGWACVVCGEHLGGRGVEYALHHRKLRSQGVDNRPSNLICVCTECHTDIHAAPAKAREAGWMLRGTDDPTQTVMAHFQYGWVLLADDGSVSHRAEETE